MKLEKAESSKYLYILISIFKAAEGKKHDWTLGEIKKISKGLESDTADPLIIEKNG